MTEKGNKRKAEEKLNEIIAEYSAKDNVFQQKKAKHENDILFSDFLQQWLTSIKGKVEEISYKGYSYSIKNMAKYFEKKNLYLKELQPYHIQEFYNTLYREGKNGNTAIHYHVLIREALQSAVKLGLVEKNVADFVDRPKKDKYQAEFYNKNELMKLFEVIKGDPLELVIHITAYYGLRRSEVLGLKWSAIDFENKMIKINHKVVEVDNKLVAKNKMKNKTSNRTLPLIPQIEQMLKAEKQKQEQNRKLCGKNYNTKYLDYVCVNPLGELLKPDFVSHHFKIIQNRHKLKHIRFHDLRHSCASLMLANGVPMKQIQEWLGHSTFQTTADIYAHLDFSSKLSSANAISTALDFEEKKEADLDNEIEELEKLLEEKRKLKRKHDFEM